MGLHAMKRILLYASTTLAVIIGAALGYALVHKPAQRELTDLRIEATPQRLERGRYLVEHVTVCLYCHTLRDFSRPTLPPTEPLGAGGTCTEATPGLVCVPNITSDAETGIGAWTDDEILRAVREGVHRDGRALSPDMPYQELRNLSDEDAYAIVAYVRTLAAVRTADARRTQINFPFSAVYEHFASPLNEPVAAPAAADTVSYGRYLTMIANCQHCHTPTFGGGVEFHTSRGTVRSSNITTHSEGVLPSDADGFVRMFRSQIDGGLSRGSAYFTVMPWFMYGSMTERDLRVMYAYLKAVPPSDNHVQTYGAAAD